VKTRIACSLALVLALAAAAPAQAGRIKAIWGPNTLANGRSAYPVYKDLGVDMLEEQLVWRDVALSRPANPRNPADPAYQWPASLDLAYRQTRRYKMKLALLVRSTPAWANGGKTGNWVPDRLADYSDFLVAAAKHYRRVKHWMIWGEPTRSAQFEPLPPNSSEGPQLYARLLNGAYGALKSVRRKNVVIGGMTFTVGEFGPSDFVRRMRLPNGKPPRLDWFGHNPFTGRRPNLHDKPLRPWSRDMSDVETLYEEVRHHWKSRHIKPKLWLSEFCVPSDKRTAAFNVHVSRKTQGRWLRDAFSIAHSRRWIAGIGWYKLEDDDNYCGLLDRSDKKKPSYRAYKRAR
jgi:hypothetical protein